LEKRIASGIGAPRALKRGRRRLDRPLFTAKDHGREAFGYFPNCISRHFGE
jgi:hypothetical protein